MPRPGDAGAVGDANCHSRAHRLASGCQGGAGEGGGSSLGPAGADGVTAEQRTFDDENCIV